MPSNQAPFKEAIEEHTLGLESNLKVDTIFEQEEKKSPTKEKTSLYKK